MHRIMGVLALALALVLGLPGAALASNDPFFPQQWALESIGAESAWNGSRGAGVVIAVVDTGVDLDHEDLAGKLVTGRSFIGGSVEDGNGHGTHVAGIAAASTDNGTGVAGVAPDARILPVQVLNSRGIGNVTDVASGIRYAADSGADVINLSFGEVSTSVSLAPEFVEAIRYAWLMGAIPVVAAGNDFVRSSGFTDEPALVVTATSRSDSRPGYASGVGAAQWGLAAPGGDGVPNEQCEADTGIVSTYGDNRYACLAGTSMAAPHVAGAAAVLRGLGLTPQQVVDQLLATADDLGAPGPDSTFGAGRLNLGRAVEAQAPPLVPPFEPPPTTEPAPTIAAAPPPAPTTEPAPATTEPAPTTTEPPATTVTLPPTTAPPAPAPSGEAVAVLEGDGDRTTRYLLAVPAGALALAAGVASWRMRRQLPAAFRPGT